MSAWKTAVCLAALIAATAHAKPTAQPENEPQQQAASDAETYCKITSVVSHDAILARLEGEKPADTENRLRQKYAPAARNAESRKLLHAAKHSAPAFPPMQKPNSMPTPKKASPNASAWKNTASA